MLGSNWGLPPDRGCHWLAAMYKPGSVTVIQVPAQLTKESVRIVSSRQETLATCFTYPITRVGAPYLPSHSTLSTLTMLCHDRQLLPKRLTALAAALAAEHSNTQLTVTHSKPAPDIETC